MPEFLQVWSWPQWAYIVLMLISLMIYAAMHREVMDKPNYNFRMKCVAILLGIIILTSGGFFT